MSYSIEIDKEIRIGDKVYSVFLEADLEYSNEEDPEPTGVEVTKAEIAPLEGDPLPLGYEGRAIEKVIVEGHPELTEAIDKILWDAIQMYSEDNYQDLIRDLQDAYDERDL
jgi:hypothetical protein